MNVRKIAAQGVVGSGSHLDTPTSGGAAVDRGRLHGSWTADNGGEEGKLDWFLGKPHAWTQPGMDIASDEEAKAIEAKVADATRAASHLESL